MGKHRQHVTAAECRGVRSGPGSFGFQAALSALPDQAVSAQVQGVMNQLVSGTVSAELALPALPSARPWGPQILYQTHSSLRSFQPVGKGDVKT